MDCQTDTPFTKFPPYTYMLADTHARIRHVLTHVHIPLIYLLTCTPTHTTMFLSNLLTRKHACARTQPFSRQHVHSQTCAPAITQPYYYRKCSRADMRVRAHTTIFLLNVHLQTCVPTHATILLSMMFTCRHARLRTQPYSQLICSRAVPVHIHNHNLN